MSMDQTTLMDTRPTGLNGLQCISLHQYWAQLVALQLKRIETRSWYTPYRGSLAIQAAKKIPNYAKDQYRLSISAQAALRDLCGIRNENELEKLPKMKIVAVCDLVDCRKIVTDNPRLIELPDKFKTDGWQEFGIYARGRYVWLLDNIRPLKEPVESRGFQGLWNLDAETIEKVLAQL